MWIIEPWQEPPQPLLLQRHPGLTPSSRSEWSCWDQWSFKAIWDILEVSFSVTWKEEKKEMKCGTHVHVFV